MGIKIVISEHKNLHFRERVNLETLELSLGCPDEMYSFSLKCGSCQTSYSRFSIHYWLFTHTHACMGYRLYVIFNIAIGSMLGVYHVNDTGIGYGVRGVVFAVVLTC